MPAVFEKLGEEYAMMGAFESSVYFTSLRAVECKPLAFSVKCARDTGRYVRQQCPKALPQLDKP